MRSLSMPLLLECLDYRALDQSARKWRDVAVFVSLSPDHQTHCELFLIELIIGVSVRACSSVG
jgi:hypothetical protein